MTRSALAALVFTLLAAAGDAPAQLRPPIPNVGPPLILRLEGVWQPTKEAARRAGFRVASFAFLGGAQRDLGWLGVTDARTVGGDQPLDGKDVLNALDPFEPNLLIAGPKDLVGRLRSAPPGTVVRVEGLVDRGSRIYYLRSVETAVEGSGRLPGPPHSARA